MNVKEIIKFNHRFHRFSQIKRLRFKNLCHLCNLWFQVFVLLTLSVCFLTFDISAEDRISIPNTKWDIEKGKRLFHFYCAYCHGERGKGDGLNAVNLDPKPRDFTDDKYMVTRTDQNLFDAISKGGAALARSTFMPPFEHTLSKEKILDIIAFIRSFAPIIKGPEITEAKKIPVNPITPP